MSRQINRSQNSSNIIKYPNTPNTNNSTTKYEQINLNYRPSDIGNVYPKCTSGRTSFGNKIRRLTDNTYIYIIYIIIYYIYTKLRHM